MTRIRTGGYTIGEAISAGLCLAAAAGGLALEVSGVATTIGPLILFAGVMGNAVVTFRSYGRRKGVAAAAYEAERAGRRRRLHLDRPPFEDEP